MVLAKGDARLLFAARLDEAMTDAGLPQRGRAERVHEKFGISAKAASKWLKGESMPETKRIAALADWLGVNGEWLLGSSTANKTPTDHTNVEPGPIIRGLVPLISWVKAGALCEAIDNLAPGDAEEWLACPFPHSKSAFCLRLVGNSMEPDYREGEVILVDPEVQHNHGSDVVVRTPDGKTTFKRYQRTEDGVFLLALNPLFPERMIKVPDDTHICGVVTASWMNRRR